MKYVLCLVLLTSCAPLSPSIDKASMCKLPDEYRNKFNSVQLNIDSWQSVQTIMGETPTNSDLDTQVYHHCKDMEFTFNGSVVVSKLVR